VRPQEHTNYELQGTGWATPAPVAQTLQTVRQTCTTHHIQVLKTKTMKTRKNVPLDIWLQVGRGDVSNYCEAFQQQRTETPGKQNTKHNTSVVDR
jgi:hypothetical protein